MPGVPTAAPTVTRPRARRPGGCAEVAVEPALGPEDAAELSRVVKALADPTRLRIVDALRTAAPEAICQCELKPLFTISQPALSKHLKVLVEAGVITAERRGAWTHYEVPPDSRLAALAGWIA